MNQERRLPIRNSGGRRLRGCVRRDGRWSKIGSEGPERKSRGENCRYTTLNRMISQPGKDGRKGKDVYLAFGERGWNASF